MRGDDTGRGAFGSKLRHLTPRVLPGWVDGASGIPEYRAFDLSTCGPNTRPASTLLRSPCTR